MTTRNQLFLAQRAAFSLAELLIAVAILGILSGVAISFSGYEWKREQINTLAIDLAGWLEVVRNNALKQTSTVVTSGGCTVTFSTLTSANPGTTLASVSPSSCAVEPNFIIPAVAGSYTYTTAITNGSGSSNNQVIFTPRGTSTNSSSVILKMRLSSTTSLRCVQVSGTLGLISIGSNESSSGAIATDTCSSFTIF